MTQGHLPAGAGGWELEKASHVS